MAFTDIAFLVFFVIVFGLWLLLRRRYVPSLVLLLVASLIFYGFRQWWVVPIILSYCLINWATGLWILRAARPAIALAVGVGFNLAVLGFWKYTPLLVATGADLIGWRIADDWPVIASSWVIPMGISFYAFTGISYMVDVYRRDIDPERNLWRYTLYTSFFPQLVAGPILRPHEFLVHLGPGTMPQRPLAMGEGAFLIGRGFSKKLVLADTLAVAIDPYFANISGSTTAGVWSLPFIYLYALQIYFDFSGYTDIARGLGLWFGYRWPENFNLPYLAVSVQDFWRRWHMTLSRFLRDYLYRPLGGNAHGAWRTAFNLMATMLLGGLWHGAGWGFLVWGGLHGFFLVVHRFWSGTAIRARLARLDGWRGAVWRMVAIVLTVHTVSLTWCFFRLPSITDGVTCVCRAASFDTAFAGGSAEVGPWVLIAGYGLAVAIARHLTRGAPLEQVAEGLMADPWRHGAFWGVAAGLLVLAVILSPGGQTQPFIYFQF
jgi:alginate O-acetyltransferase complex protein AlgI